MSEIQARVEELVEAFRRISTTQMRDLPIYNASLDVEAVGFQALDDRWVGILITPWFMSAILLPSSKSALELKHIGEKSQEALPAASYAFVNGGVEGVGSYKSLALHSPMGAFSSQDGARREAQACLTALLTPPAEPAESTVPSQEQARQSSCNLSRRAFLRGHTSAGTANKG